MLLAPWVMEPLLRLLRRGFLQEPQQKLLEGLLEGRLPEWRLLEGKPPGEKLLARELVALLLQWESVSGYTK